MNSQKPFRLPTQAEVDKTIAQAHQMRADYIAGSMKFCFARLRGLFSHKGSTAKAAA